MSLLLPPAAGERHNAQVEQAQREALEIDFWRTSTTERPGTEGLDSLTNKMSEARVLLEKFATFADLFRGATHVLELGGGQGWASCMVARAFPNARVTTSDISDAAVASVHYWETIMDVRLDSALACKSYQLPLPDASVDLVFVFAAAHHFGRHRATLTEIRRVLVPGGHALYLHEPSCREFIYRLALERVNRKRPVVREDLLRIPKIAHLASEVGLSAIVNYAPTTTYRGGQEAIYYYVLQHLPTLQRILPCSVDIVFERN